MLLILGGIATIVLVDDGVVGDGEVREGHGDVGEGRSEGVVVGEDGHGEEVEGRGGIVDIGEFVERVVNSFRLSEVFSGREWRIKFIVMEIMFCV